MIVLDASVLIAHFSPHDAYSDRALEILDTEEDIAMHHLTVAEVLAGPARNGTERDVALAMLRLGIQTLGVEPDEPLRTARIRASTGLRMPDACVLTAALQHGSALATFDGRLARTARTSGVSRVHSHLGDVEGDARGPAPTSQRSHPQEFPGGPTARARPPAAPRPSRSRSPGS